MPKNIQESGAFNTGGGAFYMPPEYFESGAYKTMDVDTWRGQSKLVAQGGYKRLRKLQEGNGILLVRFEMPFDVWCSNCGKLISMGTRFSTCEKKFVGKYFSTPIYEFRMKHFCGNWFAIRNDPKNITYAVTDGGKKRCNEWNRETADEHDPLFRTKEEREKLRADPLARADNAEKDRKKGVEGTAALRHLRAYQDQRNGSGNTARMLLRRHKEVHGLYYHNHARDEKELAKYGMTLLSETPQDAVEAHRLFATNVSKPAAPTILDRVKAAKSKPVVGQKPASPQSAARSSSVNAGASQKQDTYNILFHCAHDVAGSGTESSSPHGDDDSASDNAGGDTILLRPPPAPPVVYTLPGHSSAPQLSRLLSIVLGDSPSQLYRFSLSQLHHNLANLNIVSSLSSTFENTHLRFGEETVHLIYDYLPSVDLQESAESTANAPEVVKTDRLCSKSQPAKKARTLSPAKNVSSKKRRKKAAGGFFDLAFYDDT
ncbi:hypothetical protein DIPPA_64228 [Diplonema papillatum]|nr:hypothetical protein DIPPA_64228 [Diplonema papillatum]